MKVYFSEDELHSYAKWTDWLVVWKYPFWVVIYFVLCLLITILSPVMAIKHLKDYVEYKRALRAQKEEERNGDKAK